MDNAITKINKFIARVLGKKNNKSSNKPDQIDNEFINMLIVCVSFLLVWSLTGLYYIEDGYAGIVQSFGSAKKVIGGGSFGFTYPYPFTKIAKIHIDAVTNIPLGSDNQTSYQLVNNKSQNITIDGDFSYLIKSPLLLSDNLLFNNTSRLNDFIRMSLKSELLDYTNTQLESSNINFSIISTTIKTNTNRLLSNYGIELINFNLKDLKLHMINNLSVESKSLNDDIRQVNREISR